MSLPISAQELNEGTWLGRVWNPAMDGPSVVTVRDGKLVDISARGLATTSAILELENPAAYVRQAAFTHIDQNCQLLAPCDLQVVKAAGVTFAKSIVERVIEERAAGDLTAAQAIRHRIGQAIGASLANVQPGSAKAAELKAALMAEGLWSQYLEVGIGPDAEVFTKAPVLAAVGHGAEVGLHPMSSWNNPEPEVVLAVNSRGSIQGACLGNDVNLRDVEGRSALLLAKAKDNNASAAIGPMIRLFDGDYGIKDVERAQVSLRVEGEDGFVLSGQSNMGDISRKPAQLVAQTIGKHHQYPDGFILYCGTMFAPTEDRDAPGQGFTHHLGDQVTISAPGLGKLENRVQDATKIQPWSFGISSLMANLSRRGLL